VPSGFAGSVESGIGAFSRGTAMICGCGGLRATFFVFFGAWLGLSSSGFSGGIVGVASGKSPPPLGSFSGSTHRKKASLNSSIAAHPARPKLADKAIRTSATRARARVDTLVIRRVVGALVGAAARMAPLWLPRG
jgi:hypothetical protein